MSELRRWKLYLTLAGEPRQLIDSFTTLKDACNALTEIVGVKADRLAFMVSVDVSSNAKQSATRFVRTNNAEPYVIELVE